MPLKTHVDEQPTLNLTSMIDITFLLIIFFMVGTKFTEMERKIGLRVPQVADNANLPAVVEKKVVNIYRDGQIVLDKSPVTLNELTSKLIAVRRQNHDVGVVVRGDGDGQYQNVAEVLHACRKAGIADLAISVRAEKRR